MTGRYNDSYDNLAAAQVSVDSTGNVQVVGARPSRRAVLITMVGASDVYLSSTQGVTQATGDLLPGTKGAWVSIPYRGAVFGVCPSGGPVTVSVLEVF